MHTRVIINLLFMLFAVTVTDAQTLVSGQVKDSQTGEALGGVSITAGGSNVHTVTNDDGRFLLKVPYEPRFIELRLVGYTPLRYELSSGQTQQMEIRMTEVTVQMSEILVALTDPYELVHKAVMRIEQNYPREDELVRCFYRETTRKGSRFIAVAEAVTEMYKTDYSKGPEFDAVAIVKGRRLMSMKGRDTLGVKVQGGPILPLMTDVAKNRDYILNKQALAYCHLRMGTPERVNNRMQFVVIIEPDITSPFPLLGGRLFIDQESLAFTRAELQLDMRDWRKATSYMLVRKPMGLHFHPKELSINMVYHTDEHGITRMNYLCNVMRFNCDWKRRLFASSYTTVCEMVVTDRLHSGHGTVRPKGRNSFGVRERFYDRVEYFNDPDFWEDYNIILPTESLEHAIDKLKKRKEESNQASIPTISERASD